MVLLNGHLYYKKGNFHGRLEFGQKSLIRHTFESDVEVVGVKEGQDLLVASFIFPHELQLFGADENRESLGATTASLGRSLHTCEDVTKQHLTSL